MTFKTNPVIFLIRKLWTYSFGNRRAVVIYFIMFVLGNLAALSTPLIIGKVLNIIQEQGVNQANIYQILTYLSAFIFVPLTFWLFHGPARVIEKKNAFWVRKNYKKYFIDNTMKLPISWHTDNHSGDTIDKINQATDALYRFSESSYSVIEAVIRLSFAFGALVYFNFHSAYIALFLITLALTIVVKFDKHLIPEYRKLFKMENKVAAKVYDSISNITTVVILRIEKMVSKSISQKMIKPFNLYHKTNKTEELKWFLAGLCSSFMAFFVIATYVYFDFKNGVEIMIGTIYILYNYLNTISQVFFNFAFRYSTMVNQKTAIENTDTITQQFKEKERVNYINLKNSNWQTIKIDNLNFSYDKNKNEEKEKNTKLHLDNVSININKNQKIAFIGESGSGKTTTLKVIRQLYEASVEVYLDDKPLALGFNELSSNISLIPQEPEIFTTTIKENITMGMNYSLERIKKYTNMACFTKIAEKLPNQFESSIVEKGVNLSGGEKQRLALSRGLLASENKSIVLLDEPTSSVDSRNELKIYKNIFKEFKDKTIISSIHRLHLLPLFDMIYYFDNGKIIAQGTFKELKNNSPEFKTMLEKYSLSNKLDN